MKKLLISAFGVTLLILLTIVAYAHPGKTDSSGGHNNNSTGDYHYHHGYSAHDHYDMDGDGYVDCPYDFDDKTNHNSSSNTGNRAPDTTHSDNETDQTNQPQKRNIFLTLLSILGISIMVLLVGFSSGILILLHSLLTSLIEKIIKKCCKEEKLQKSALDKSETIVTIFIVVVVVAVISIIVWKDYI